MVRRTLVQEAATYLHVKNADYLEKASFRIAVSQYLSILASQTKIGSVEFAAADDSLLQ
ncbi:hypothetical protein AB1K62_08355 [Parasphingorhabdus sp. JC815]|uniref:hypothetical protein n=1 Tax=Parasphingorhabdus sp. JC815 TaxID=3232140 RepID=UPI0034593467